MQWITSNRSGQRLRLALGLFLVTLVGATTTWWVTAQAESPEARNVSVDTSRLMGLPDSHEVFGIENAFPHLKFSRPVEVTHAGDGSNRIFVAEQDGRVLVWDNKATAKDAKVFLDLSQDLHGHHNEEGLLGLTFHPKYRENGEFFIFYSLPPRGSVVSRLRVSKHDPNRADRDSEEVLLQFPKPYSTHTVGSLKFGPDGFLYVAVGDGGLAHDPHENGQGLETLLGSILRIDVDRKDSGKNYAIPKDNPFVGQGPKVCGEIWASGLRAPWRIGFDRQTGTLWVGDVGQNRFEEVNVIVRGGNYGWNLREGKEPLDPTAIRDSVQPLIDPVFAYPHAEGKSVTGGLVYRGERLPSLKGAYIYADFLSGNIWALRWDGKKAVANDKIARTSLLISSFGEDEAGELYFTAFDGGIYRFKTPEKEPRRDFPRTLTETGLFSSVKEHKMAPGLIPYDVNVPLWSDDAAKDRYLALPRNGGVVFKERDQWEFPVGTVIVKTFLLQTDMTNPEKRRRLETRLWLQSPRGWEGYTYLWNDEQTDAVLLADFPFKKEYEVKTPEGFVKQEWYFPSRSDCQACHTQGAGFVLGWNTRQLNRHETSGKENQIEKFKRLKLFTQPVLRPAAELEAYPKWEDEKAPLATRARAYLAVNCSLCHNPGGSGTWNGSQADLTFHQPFETAFPIPFDPDAKRWIAPEKPQHSNLFQRMKSRHHKDQMPPIGTQRPDRVALDVLQRWIAELKEP